MAATRSAPHDRLLDLPPRPRILGIRFSALGDTLLTFPAMRALRRRWPDAHVAYLTGTRQAPLFDGMDAVDEVLQVDRSALKRLRPGALGALARHVLWPLIGRHWDLVVDFQGFSETALLAGASGAGTRVGRHYKTRARWLYRPWIERPHPDQYMAGAHLDTLVRARLVEDTELARWRAAPATPYFDVSNRAREEWDRRRRALQVPAGQGPLVAVFVGAAKPEKAWPVARFGDLVSRLTESVPASRFVVFGGPGDDSVVEAVLARARPAIPESRLAGGGHGTIGGLAAAFADASFTISNDTGPMHLSAAVGTPTLGIYRRRMPHFQLPRPHRHVLAPDGAELRDLEVKTVADEAASLMSVGS